MSKIEGKVVLVTGANRGIGKNMVQHFLNNGASKVYAAARKPESVEVSDDRIVPVQLDLSDSASVQAAAEVASDAQIVINNGGVLTDALPLDPKAFDNFAFELDVNVLGLLRVAQAFAPVLKANGGGVFGQVNSVVSVKSFAGISTYSASKAASYSFTQALKEQFAEQGTQVVSIHPGPIATDMIDGTGFEESAESADVVSQGLVDAIENDKFHVFPDSFARNFWAGYESYATNFVEASFAEEAH